MKLALAVAPVLLASLAQAQPSAWLRDRVDVEWVVGAGGWRAAVGPDARAPGFDALAGGGEFALGLDVGAGLGVVADGRVLAGQAGGAHTYLEGLGALLLQIRVGRVRLRVGPAAGQALWRGDSAILVGGLVAGSIDLFALGAGRLSTALTLRLDVDADVGSRRYFPDSSLAFAIGLGVRY